MESTLKTYLHALKAYGLKNNIPNVSEAVGQFLNMMIQVRKPQHILEIGSANGYSTLWMAEAARKVGAILHTLDHSEPSFKQLQDNLLQTGFSDLVFPHFGKALALITGFPAQLTFDFVFVDGQKAQYLDFFKAIEPRLKTGAVVIFDDMMAFQKKTQALTEYLSHLKGFDALLLPIDQTDGIVWIVKQ